MSAEDQIQAAMDYAGAPDAHANDLLFPATAGDFIRRARIILETPAEVATLSPAFREKVREEAQRLVRFTIAPNLLADDETGALELQRKIQEFCHLLLETLKTEPTEPRKTFDTATAA